MKKILFVLALVFACLISNGQKLLYVNENLIFPTDSIVYGYGDVCFIYRNDTLLTTYDKKDHNIVKQNFPKDLDAMKTTLAKILMDLPPLNWKDIIVWDIEWEEDRYGESNIAFTFELPCGQTKTLKKVEIKLNFYNNIDEYVTSKTFTGTGYKDGCDEFSVDFDLYLPSQCYHYKIAYVKTYFTDGSVSMSYNTADKVEQAKNNFIAKYTAYVTNE